MTKVWKTILLLGLLVAACGGGPKEAGPAATLATQFTQAPAAVQAPEETETGRQGEEGTGGQGEEGTTLKNSARRQGEEGTALKNSARGEGEVDLTEPASGLEALPGYQAVLQLAFSGQKDGQPYQAAKTYTLTVLREPAARLLAEEATAPDGTHSRRLFAELASVAYRQDAADGPCLASLTDGEGAQTLFEPARLLPHLLGAEETGEESLEGVSARVVQFDAKALGANGQGAGTAWISKDGGTLLRYSLSLQGGAEVFGPGMQGEQTWEYRLTQPGAQALQLPEACPQDNMDLPALPDSQNTLRLPGYLRYTTHQDAERVKAFYTEQLAPAGWQPAGDPLETGGGTRWLFLRLAGDKEESALLTVRTEGTGVGVTLAVVR